MVSDHDKQNILKKKQARIKHAISKVFVFNHEWKRKSFQTHHPTDHDIERFYQRDTFPNQRQFGRQIYQAFEDLNVTHALAVASTQSGKPALCSLSFASSTRTTLHTASTSIAFSSSPDTLLASGPRKPKNDSHPPCTIAYSIAITSKHSSKWFNIWTTY